MKNMKTEIESNRTLTESEVIYYEDPLDRPGTIKKAQEHGSAQKVYSIPDNFEPTDVDFCECCNLPCENKNTIKPFSFFVDIKEFSKYGLGTYFYFFFYKYVILSLVVILGMYSIPATVVSQYYANEIVDYCTVYNSNFNNICSKYDGKNIFVHSNWLYQLSYESLNKTMILFNQIPDTEGTFPLVYYLEHPVDFNFLNFLALVTLFIINVLFIVLMTHLKNEADYEEITPSDFNLMISNIPKNFRDDNSLNEDILELVN